MTIEDGYAIQREWVKLEMADGRSIKGRKIGLTSRAMQQASQITEPDYAPLMDDMFFATGSTSHRALYRTARRGGARVRAGASRCSGPGVTLFDVLQATDYVVPALEIIDARIEQFDRETRAPRKVFDTIADFAANAGIVLGGRPVQTRCDRSALGRRAALQERGHRGERVWPQRCSIILPRGRVARQQDRPLRRTARYRRRRPRRLVHASDDRGARRRAARRLRAAGRHLGSLCLKQGHAIPLPRPRPLRGHLRRGIEPGKALT